MGSNPPTADQLLWSRYRSSLFTWQRCQKYGLSGVSREYRINIGHIHLFYIIRYGVPKFDYQIKLSWDAHLVSPESCEQIQGCEFYQHRWMFSDKVYRIYRVLPSLSNISSLSDCWLSSFLSSGALNTSRVGWKKPRVLPKFMLSYPVVRDAHSFGIHFSIMCFRACVFVCAYWKPGDSWEDNIPRPLNDGWRDLGDRKTA